MRVDRLTADLVALGPGVDIDEARAVAKRAQFAIAELKREYRMAWPPWWHNILVNHGVRSRGLCFHWADDLHSRLRPLEWHSLELDLVVAREHTDDEHNCVSVRVRNAPWDEAIVIDPWRKAGNFFWVRIRQDRYPWRPFRQEPTPGAR